MMRQFIHQFTHATQGRKLYDITSDIVVWVAEQGVASGLLTLYIQHTSASLLINENYDADVLVDMEAFFNRLVPDGDALFIHTAEGPDDMPAHVRSALTQTSLSIPIINGKAALGQWQGVFLFEHRHVSKIRDSSPNGRSLSTYERLIYQDYFPQTVLTNARIIEDRVPFWLLKTMAGVVLGNYIYFRKNTYQPDTAAGIEFLGHELTHVAQNINGMTVLKYLWASRYGYRQNPYEIAAYAQGAKIKMDFNAIYLN